jgi:hypothetical protein
VKEEHGGERGSEVIDQRTLVDKCEGEGADLLEESGGLGGGVLRGLRVWAVCAEGCKAGSDPEGVGGDLGYGHLLEVGGGACSAKPETAGLVEIVGGGGQAKPVERLRLAGEEMPGLAERLGWGERLREQSVGAPRLAGCKRLPGEQDASADELREDEAFAALPGLEVAREDKVEGALRLAGEVEEGGEFDGEVVAPWREGGVTQELGEAGVGRDAGALPKLVALVEEARVGWIGCECAIEGRE